MPTSVVRGHTSLDHSHRNGYASKPLIPGWPHTQADIKVYIRSMLHLALSVRHIICPWEDLTVITVPLSMQYGTLLLSKPQPLFWTCPKLWPQFHERGDVAAIWTGARLFVTVSLINSLIIFPLLFRCISLCNGSAASNRRSGKGAIGGYWESDGTVEHMIAVRAPPVTATASLHSWYYARLPAILWRHTFVVKTFGICNSMQVHYMTISRNYPEASWWLSATWLRL